MDDWTMEEIQEFATYKALCFCKRWRIRHCDQDDVKQEAVMYSLIARMRHDKERGDMQRFLGFCIDRHLKHWMHQQAMVRRCYKHRYRGYPHRSEMPVEVLEAKPVHVPAEPLGILRLFVSVLPRLQRQRDKVLLIKLLMGEPLAVQARALGITREAVRLQKVRLFQQLAWLLKGKEVEV